MELALQSHSPEPAAGTIRTADGRQADLFDSRHYPVQAVCRVCSQPIQAERFLCSFAHVEDGEPARQP